LRRGIKLEAYSSPPVKWVIWVIIVGVVEWIPPVTHHVGQHKPPEPSTPATSSRPPKPWKTVDVPWKSKPA